MTAGKPTKSTKGPSQEASHRNRKLLLALSRAAQSIQQARTVEELYSAAGREIKSLGGEVALLMVNEDAHSLSVAYLSNTPKIIRQAEKLMGLSARDYRIPFSPNSIYGKVLSGEKAVFLSSTEDATMEALPEAGRPLAGALMQVLKLRQGILAPLRVDGQNLGLLTLSGLLLHEDDAPALESFAGQIAVGLQNIRLMQKLQDELAVRTKTEEQLQLSTSTYEGIFNGITEAVYILDENGVFIKVNSGAEKMYGYPPDHFVGRTPEFLSAPGKNDLARVMDYIRQAFLGQTVEFEFWGLRKDGSIFPKDVRLTPGTYFGREVVIAVGRDMTERKQAEDALEKSEAQYRLLADHTTDTIWMSDMSLRTTYVSPSAAKIRGYTLEQLHELPLDQNLTPDSFQRAMEMFAAEMPKVYADPTYSPVLTLELDFRNRDGKIYSTESKLSLIRDTNGNPASILGESRDITERRQAQKVLLESERYYRALIENATDGILVVNVDGTIRFESPSVARMLGYEPDTLIGMSAFDLIDPDDLEQLAKTFIQGLTTPGFTHSGEYRLRHSSGEWRYFEIVSHYLAEDPVIAGIIINGRDITERKQAENELRRANESLETAHRELQKMFAHEQLLARTDGLTALYNRRYFFELAAREFKASVRYRRPLTIILFDVDGFKQANDTFGHATGDAILLQIAQTATALIRSVDVVARYGGDEFIILLPQTHAQEAFHIAERIRNSVAANRVTVEDTPFTVTLSLGVSEILHSPEDLSVEDIIRRADRALYKVKQNGGNLTSVFALDSTGD